MTTEQIQEESVRPTAGKLLKQGRETAGKSVEDIAKKLHLRVKNIEDIEADRVDPKISLTFYKGYLKLYAKFVNVSEQRVLEAFASENNEAKEPAKLQSFSRRVSKQANDDRLMMITYMVIVVVIALVILWWFQQSSILTDANETSAVELVNAEMANGNLPNSQAATETSAQNDFAQDNPPASDITTGLTSDIAATELALAEPANTLNEASNTMQQAGAGADNIQNIADVASESVDTDTYPETASTIELIFEFSGDCWMNLIDASGEAIAYGVKRAGRIMPVSGVPPFQVILGAPEAVQISYNGRPVNMSRFTAGQTARFSLPLTE